MTSSFIPRSHTERDQAIAACAAYLAASDAKRALTEIITDELAAPQEAYLAARDAHEARCSESKAARITAEAAETAFQYDLRWFTVTLRDSKARAVPHVISELLGGVLPSALANRTYAEQLRHVSTLFNSLPSRADLSYDASRAETLRTSAAALQTAALNVTSATRALKAARLALDSSLAAYEPIYAQLIRVGRAKLGTAALKQAFPCFARKSPSAASGETATVAAASPVAEG